MADYPVQIAPSLMCADLCNFGDNVRRLEACGVDMFHLDIMDGHFVPNMVLGLEIIRQIRPRTAVPFDAHLMVENAEFFVQQFLEIGVQQISVHAESVVHLDRMLARIREHGVRAGVALNPATPLDVLTYVLERLDFVLIMTVNPGFAGQRLVPAGLRKIADCRRFLDDHGISIPIQVDGNVSFEHIPEMIAAGASILVGGSGSVFYKGDSIENNIARMREAIEQGVRLRRSRQG